MVLIGPRPLSIPDLHLIKLREPELYERRRRLRSKPGISGPWQIFGNKLKGVENLVLLDEYYDVHKSFYVDMLLVIFTVYVLVFGKHSDSILLNAKIKKSKWGDEYSFIRDLFPNI